MLSHYQTFVLYNFGEIKPRSCLFWFVLHWKSSHTPYLLYYSITSVHKFRQRLVQLTSGPSRLLHHSLSNNFTVSFWRNEVSKLSVFSFFLNRKKSLMLHIYCTITSLWSISSEKGWCSWLQDHPNYSITHYETFLLYHFGEIKRQSCLFFLSKKNQNSIFNKFWQRLVQLTSGPSSLHAQSLSNIFTVLFLRY